VENIQWSIWHSKKRVAEVNVYHGAKWRVGSPFAFVRIGIRRKFDVVSIHEVIYVKTDVPQKSFYRINSFFTWQLQDLYKIVIQIHRTSGGLDLMNVPVAASGVDRLLDVRWRSKGNERDSRQGGSVNE
jgi:hypothetical protein